MGKAEGERRAMPWLPRHCVKMEATKMDAAFVSSLPDMSGTTRGGRSEALINYTGHR